MMGVSHYVNIWKGALKTWGWGVGEVGGVGGGSKEGGRLVCSRSRKPASAAGVSEKTSNDRG